MEDDGQNDTRFPKKKTLPVPLTKMRNFIASTFFFCSLSLSLPFAVAKVMLCPLPLRATFAFFVVACCAGSRFIYIDCPRRTHDRDHSSPKRQEVHIFAGTLQTLDAAAASALFFSIYTGIYIFLHRNE